MESILIQGATVVNEGQTKYVDVRIEGERITQVAQHIDPKEKDKLIDAKG